MTQAVVLSSSTPSTLPPAVGLPFVFEEDRPLYLTAHKLQEAIGCLAAQQEAEANLLLDTIPEHIRDRIYLQLSVSMQHQNPDVPSGRLLFIDPRQNPGNVSKKIEAIRFCLPKLLSYQGQVRAIADLLDKREELRAMRALDQLPSFIQHAACRHLPRSLKGAEKDHEGKQNAQSLSLLSTIPLAQRATALRAVLPWLNNEHFPAKFCHRLMDFLDPQSLHTLSQTCGRLHQYATFQLHLLWIKGTREDLFRNQSPLILIVPQLIRICADKLSAKDPTLTFEREFRFGLHQWEHTGSSITAAQALVRHIQLPLLKAGEWKRADKAARYMRGFIGRGIEAFKSEWQTFTSTTKVASKRDLFCATLKHYSNLGETLAAIYFQKKHEHAVMRKLYAHPETALQYAGLISSRLKDEKQLSPIFRSILKNFGNRLFNRCTRRMESFFRMESALFEDNFRHGFVQKARLSDIDELVYGESQAMDTRFFEEHRRLYLSFGEQIQNFYDWITVEFRAIQKAQRLLKNYNLFIRMCDLAALEQETSKKPAIATDDFLISKLEVFSEELEHDRARQLASLPHMKNAALKTHLQTMVEVMQAIKSYQILVQSRLFYPLQTCRKYRHHLSYVSPLEETGKKLKVVNPAAATASDCKAPAKAVDASPGSVPIFTLGPQKPIAVASSPPIFTLSAAAPKTVSIETSLASMGKIYADAFRTAKENRSLAVQEALTNAEYHLRNIFPLMERLHLGTRSPLNRQLLFATMIGFMREGALMVEQQLRAILLQTNPKAIPSHNLIDLVREAALPLSFEERGLILLLNRAEILSRDIAHFEGETEGTGQFRQASDLLLFYYRWAKTPDSSVATLLDATVHCETLQLCLSLLNFLPSVKGAKQNPDALSQLQVALEGALQSFSAQLRVQGKEAPDAPRQANPQQEQVVASLKAIEAAIMHLQTQKNTGYFSLHFDNLIHNKLARLRCEMMRHWELSANEVRLHYADLSQLTHLIAEEFMDVLLYLRGDLVDPSSFQHDLVPRLEALGIPLATLSSTERRFCEQSNALLNVTRYASHPVYDQSGAEQKKKKQMKVASQNERSKVAPALLHAKADDFQPVMDKKLKALQQTQIEILAEIDTLAALLRRLIKPMIPTLK